MSEQNTRSKVLRCVGMWRRQDRTAGGSPACPSFLSNPQFRLELSAKQQDCTVTVMQAGAGPPHPIGFVVLQAAERYARRGALGRAGGPYGYQALVALRPSVPKPAARVSSCLKLERDDELPFIIVPYTAEADCEANFVIEVASNFPCALHSLPAKGALDLADSAPALLAPNPGVGGSVIAQSDADELQQVLATAEEAGPYEDPSFSGATALSGRHSAAAEEPAAWEWVRPADELRANGALEAQAELARETPLLPPESWQHLNPPLSKEAAEQTGAGEGVVGGLAVLASSSPHALQRCFPKGLLVRQGVLAVRFWQFDEWALSITDDRLPAMGGRLVLGGSADQHVVLFGLILKAYAKTLGSYTMLRGIHASELLVDLTGGVPQTLSVFLGTDPARLGEADVDHVWHELQEWLGDSPALVGCEQVAASRAEEAKVKGIRPRSTYVVLEAAVVGDERLLCLRNPWHGSSWAGRWRAGAPEWLNADADNLTPLHHLVRRQSPHAAAAVVDRNGAFWISLRDFCVLFDRAFSCRLFPETVPRAIIADAWEGESAGGCLNFASWRRNPQYHLKLSRDCRVIFVLSQPPLHDSEAARTYASIGMCALRGENLRRRLTLRREDILGKSTVS
eukprot:5707508-Prymnesium_polylepis.1